MNTDTPETDAAWACFKGYMEPLQDVQDLSRKLERERAQAREIIDEAREVLKITQEAWVKAKAERVEALRERDEAREYADRLAEGLPDGMLPKDVEVLREANLGLATELAAVTAQRDGMEEKLRIELRGHPDSELWGDAGLIAATMRCVDALDVVTEQRDRLAEALQMITTFDCSDLQCDNGHGCRYVAIEALQSLTQKP
jgi:hypothetical protein